MIVRLDLERAVADPVRVRELLASTIEHGVCVGAADRDEMGRDSVHLRREGPHVEVVHVDHAIDRGEIFREPIEIDVRGRILQQDPHSTNYFGSKDVGQFLSSVMRPGGSRDWRELMQETLGEDMSADAMLRYFDPLMEWLRAQNRGRIHTLPEV